MTFQIQKPSLLQRIPKPIVDYVISFLRDEAKSIHRSVFAFLISSICGSRAIFQPKENILMIIAAVFFLGLSIAYFHKFLVNGQIPKSNALYSLAVSGGSILVEISNKYQSEAGFIQEVIESFSIFQKDNTRVNVERAVTCLGRYISYLDKKTSPILSEFSFRDWVEHLRRECKTNRIHIDILKYDLPQKPN